MVNLIKNSNASNKLAIGQIFSIVFSGVGTFAAARICGSGDFGIVLIGLSILSIGVDFADFGGCAWSSREISRRAISLRDYLDFMKSKIILLILLWPLWILLGRFLFSSFFDLCIIYLYPILWLQTSYFQAIVLHYKEVKLSIVGILLERFCWILVVPLAILGLDGRSSFILSIIIGLVAHVIVFWLFILKQVPDYDFFKFDKFKYLYSKKHGNLGIISATSDFAILDTWLVSKFSTLSESGVYGLALRFRNPFQLSANIVGSRLKPVLARRDFLEARIVISESRNLIVFNILGLIFVTFGSFLVLPLILPFGFENLKFAFPIGCLAVIFLGISTIAKISMVALDFENLVKVLTIIGTFLTLIFIGIGASLLGALGATIAYALMTILFALLDSFFLLRILRNFNIL